MTRDAEENPGDPTLNPPPARPEDEEDQLWAARQWLLRLCLGRGPRPMWNGRLPKPPAEGVEATREAS